MEYTAERFQTAPASCAMHTGCVAVPKTGASPDRRVRMAVAATSKTGPDLIGSARDATAAVEALLADATRAVAERVRKDGRISGVLLDRGQRAAHGLSWLAAYVE